MTDTDLKQDSFTATTSTRGGLSDLLSWPGLGILLALLTTVIWCGFLVWVVTLV